jgi:hypothetical protein
MKKITTVIVFSIIHMILSHNSVNAKDALQNFF